MRPWLRHAAHENYVTTQFLDDIIGGIIKRNIKRMVKACLEDIEKDARQMVWILFGFLHGS